MNSVLRSVIISTLVLSSLHSSKSSSSEDRLLGDLDVMLRGNSDHEGWNVDGLLSDSNVLLLDEDSSLVDGGTSHLS